MYQLMILFLWREPLWHIYFFCMTLIVIILPDKNIVSIEWANRYNESQGGFVFKILLKRERKYAVKILNYEIGPQLEHKKNIIKPFYNRGKIFLTLFKKYWKLFQFRSHASSSVSFRCISYEISFFHLKIKHIRNIKYISKL